MVCKISKMLKNEEMTDSSVNTKSNKKICVEIKTFYNRHFPTDRKTYNFRVPLVGLILSILSLHLVTTSFAVRFYFRLEDENNLIRYCYIFISAALSYELYYGLKIGDRKQFTPWILLKFLELILTFATIIYIFAEEWWHLRFYVPQIIYGIILLALNGIVTYIVTSTSVKQFRGYASKDNNVEDVYDTYDNA